MSTLFYNANLLMTGEEYSQGNALEVEDGIITWIGTINPFQKLNDNMENINLNGAYVLPGFLDFESHSYFAEFFNAVKNKGYECFQDDWLDDSVEVLKDKGITSLFLSVHYSMKFFANMHCIRSIKAGKTIYDMDEEGENELFNLLMNQTF